MEEIAGMPLPFGTQQSAQDWIGRIYDAALQPQTWPVLMADLAAHFGASSSMFSFYDRLNPQRNLRTSTGLSEALLQEYGERWAARDLELHAPLTTAQGIGKVFTRATAFGPDSLPTYREYVGEYYAFLQQADAVQTMSLLLAFGDYEWGFASFFRAEASGDFDSNTQAALQRLAEHLRRALQIHRQFVVLQDQHERLAELLDRIASPLLLLNADLQVIRANRKAAATLKGVPALALTGDNRLKAWRRDDDGQLQQRLRTAVARSVNDGEQAGGVVALRHPDLIHPIKISVTPLSACGPLSGLAQEGVRAALFISDPNVEREVDATYLRKAYGLTGREVAIAHALLNGCSLDEIANNHAVSVNTVRSQLKTLFRKTSTGSQQQLVSLLSALTYEFVHEVRMSAIDNSGVEQP